MNKQNFERLKLKGLVSGSWLEHQRSVRASNKLAREMGYARGLSQFAKENKMNKKGQQTIIGVMIGIMTIITFVVLLPILTQFIDIGKNATNSSMIQMLMDLFPIFLGLGILISILIYTTASQPVQ